MKRIAFIVLTFLSFYQISTAQNEITIVTGHAPEYADRYIVFFTFLEKQFDSRDTVADIKVDHQGLFSFSFDCPVTKVLYCETISYTAYFFAERGRNYTLTLPSKIISEAETVLSPFFIPPVRHIIPDDSVVNGLKDLNYAIRDFDNAYEPFLNRQILQYYDYGQNKIITDSSLLHGQSDLKVTDPIFFSEYIRYRTARLEFLTRQCDMSVLSNKYLINHPLAMNNPAFWDFYALFFDHYISSLSSRKGFTGIYELIGKEKFDSLTLLLKIDPVLENDTIRELVLMNELYQGFYEKDYPLMLTLNLLDSIHDRSASSLNVNIAVRLKKSITSLHPGYSPPPFTVKHPEGMEYKLEDFKGKYLYLGFCSLNHLGSLKEIEYLKYQYSKHHIYLQILIIVPEREKNEIKSFTENNSISWPVLYGSDNSSLFREYKVKTFPAFYLIDKQGKLALSPSPLPSENFENYLFMVMKTNGDI